MSTDSNRRDHELVLEADLPGGSGVTRTATVVTSAALGGVATGALVGSVAGPVGTAIGAAIGAVAAGLGGNAVTNQVDAEAEAAHWRENYRTRPYVDPDASFDDYGPAYDYGVAGYVKYSDRTFEDAEADLSRDWDVSRMSSRLEWSHAREASLDAWMRAHGRRSPRA